MQMLKGNTHTHTRWSDGRETPERMIQAYKDAGYDFVIMTDHRNEWKPYSYPQVEGIIVINGCEYSAGEHVTYAVGDNEELKIKNHPNRYNDPIEEVEEWDLYEVTEHARLQPQYFKCRGNFPVFSDDSHSLQGVGHAGILVMAEPNKDAIIKAIKQGNFRLWAAQLG